MKVKNGLESLFSVPLFSARCGRLKQALYLLMLVKCAYWAASFDLYFGTNPLSVFKAHASAGIRELPMLLYDSHTPWISAICLMALALLCFSNLFFSSIRVVADALIWLLTINLHYKVYATLTGGDYLLNQLLFFNIFLAGKNAISRSPGRIFFHNLGFIAVVIQVSMVYLVSAIAKINDPAWRDGTALVLTSHAEHYRMFALRSWMLPQLWMAAGYFIIAWQALFPFLVWWRPVKIWTLLVGIVIHLYIAFGMGLLFFGITMIAAYIPFWPIRRERAQAITNEAVV